jgi:hypothetical protein
VRHVLRADHHPARAVPCPHCEAAAHAPCTTVSKRHRLSAAVTTSQVHASRITAWARTTSACPVCQVAPGAECHNGGWPLPGSMVHPERTELAGETA